jgi:parvulin-like peptidyl-prolyl isomerase
MLYWDCAERHDRGRRFFVRDLRRILILPVAAAFLFAAAACGGDDDGDVPSNAVAVIGDQTVTKADFDRLLNQARSSYKESKREFPKPGTEEYVQLRDQIVSYLVQRAQFAEEAEQRDIEVSDQQVDKRLDQLVQQFFDGNQKRYEKQLKDNGVTEDQVRSDIRAQLIQEELFKNVTEGVKVSDAEARKYYAENKDQYQTPAQRDIRHILVKNNQKALADDLTAQLRSGASFPKLARQHSQDPGSKKQGGRLEISKGQTVAPFDKVAFSIARNKISNPVKTQFGWHVIEALSAVKPAKTTPFKQVKEAIRQQLLQTKKNEKSSSYVEDLKKSDDVSYQVGFAPRKAATETTSDQ